AGTQPTPTSSPPAAVQRIRCLVALLAVAPLQAGDAVLPEVYSPHLDLHQRLTLLEALEGAAQELAADPRVTPRLVQGPGGAPQLVEGPPGAASRQLPLQAGTGQRGQQQQPQRQQQQQITAGGVCEAGGVQPAAGALAGG
ncbi:hypothetical protein Agub_g1557, partial [Astrephomene gubernaculifera]